MPYSNWLTHVITLYRHWQHIHFGRCKIIVASDLQFHSRIRASVNEMAATRFRFTQLLSNNTHLINAYASRHPLRIEARQFHNQYNSKNQIKSWHPLANRIYCEYLFDCSMPVHIYSDFAGRLDFMLLPRWTSMLWFNSPLGNNLNVSFVVIE